MFLINYQHTVYTMRVLSLSCLLSLTEDADKLKGEFNSLRVSLPSIVQGSIPSGKELTGWDASFTILMIMVTDLSQGVSYYSL